jgi:hypothetical protein
MQVHFHAATLRLLRRDDDLVLRGSPEHSAEFPRILSSLLPPLVLRVTCQDSSYSRTDHKGLGRHRVLRDVPGHSGQRRWSNSRRASLGADSAAI